MPRDAREAARWYRRAAAQVEREARYRLGRLHERGPGVTADPRAARAWYRKAAADAGLKAARRALDALGAEGRTRGSGAQFLARIAAASA